MAAEHDALTEQFHRAVGEAVSRCAAAPDAAAAWRELAALGAVAFGLPLDAGGLDLGAALVLGLCRELGRRAVDSNYLDTALAADCLLGAGPGAAPLLAAVVDQHQRIGCLGLAGSTVSPTVKAVSGGLEVSGPLGHFAGPADVDALLVRVAAPEGPTLFWLERARSGLSLRTPGDVAGGAIHAAFTESLRLAPGDRVGEAGRADHILEPALRRAHLRQAGYLAGLARGVFEETRRHVTQRQQFGRALVQFQAVSFPLAALLAEISALELKAAHCAGLEDAGAPDALAALECAAMGAELALDSARRGLHYHGAPGMVQGTAIERVYRRAVVEAVRLGPAQQLWAAAAGAREAARAAAQGGAA